MDDLDVIKAMDDHAAKFGIAVTSIGQYAAKSRLAYDRIKRGTAHRDTKRAVISWLASDAVERESLPQ